MFRQRRLQPIADRGPLRVLFLVASMPEGDAASALVESLRRMDRGRFLPELGCPKRLDPSCDSLVGELPIHTGLLRGRFDLGFLPRLKALLRRRRIDAVVTIGTARDGLFWGWLAARWARLPVVCAALHGAAPAWRGGWLNRILARLTDRCVTLSQLRGSGQAAPAAAMVQIASDCAELISAIYAAKSDRFTLRRPQSAARDATLKTTKAR